MRVGEWSVFVTSIAETPTTNHTGWKTVSVELGLLNMTQLTKEVQSRDYALVEYSPRSSGPQLLTSLDLVAQNGSLYGRPTDNALAAMHPVLVPPGFWVRFPWEWEIPANTSPVKLRTSAGDLGLSPVSLATQRWTTATGVDGATVVIPSRWRVWIESVDPVSLDTTSKLRRAFSGNAGPDPLKSAGEYARPQPGQYRALRLGIENLSGRDDSISVRSGVVTDDGQWLAGEPYNLAESDFTFDLYSVKALYPGQQVIRNAILWVPAAGLNYAVVDVTGLGSIDPLTPRTLVAKLTT
jgi:hypothetical protein